MTHPPTAADLDHDRRARALLRELRHEALPPYVPGETPGVVALAAAERAARALLRMAARKHKLDHWDWPTFRAFFLEDVFGAALAADVEQRPGEVALVTRTCPLREEAARDPRACRWCQMVPEAAARLAVPDEVREVRHDALITAGAPACVTRVLLRSDADPPRIQPEGAPA